MTLLVLLFFSRSTVTLTISYATYYRSSGATQPIQVSAGLQEAINQLLVREFRSGRRTIIVIDEAQSLDTPVLETIRLLSNFETQSEKLLQIILAGQPQLAQRLANPELAQLHQRISILTTLIPFDLEDTRNYIEHRLKSPATKDRRCSRPQH